MSKKQPSDKQVVENPHPQLQPGQNILTANTREDLAEQAASLTVADGHIIFGAVGQDVEHGVFTLRVDYIKDE